ncbi:MAG TPA: hypothetical protein VG497_22790 [Kribbella sp.]|nr:hypothetical protein [Kribbella sp.]
MDEAGWSPDQVDSYELAADLCTQVTALTSARLFRADEPAVETLEDSRAVAAEFRRRFRALRPGDPEAVLAFSKDCLRRIEQLEASR